jgi:riboflavin biosynthesis pyrimidine reductase
MSAKEKPTPTLRRLFPFLSGSTTSAGIPEILDELAAAAARRKTEVRTRPHVLLNMASTADGRASVNGRAGPIGDRADSALLHGLRTVVDGLLVGAGTARAEHYARVLRGKQDRATRRAHGLAAELHAFILTSSLNLTPESVPLLAEPEAPVTIVTASAGQAAPCPADPDYLRCGQTGELDLAAALECILKDYQVSTLLCEGGPHLGAQLVSKGLVDELFMSLAPKLAGGEEHLRILAGDEIEPPLHMTLVSLYEHESMLFLRYRL